MSQYPLRGVIDGTLIVSAFHSPLKMGTYNIASPAIDSFTVVRAGVTPLLLT